MTQTLNYPQVPPGKTHTYLCFTKSQLHAFNHNQIQGSRSQINNYARDKSNLGQAKTVVPISTFTLFLL